MKRRLKFILLIIILIIPVLIFLFLKSAGDNRFTIPVYYESGVPEDQQFDCSFSGKPYTITWDDSLNLRSNVLFYFNGGNDEIQETEKENIFRRIVANTKTDLDIVVFNGEGMNLNVSGIRQISLSSDELIKSLHCIAASDTLNQFILSDKNGRIRGYYNRTLEEQDRLLVELKILEEEKP